MSNGDTLPKVLLLERDEKSVMGNVVAGVDADGVCEFQIEQLPETSDVDALVNEIAQKLETLLPRIVILSGIRPRDMSKSILPVLSSRFGRQMRFIYVTEQGDGKTIADQAKGASFWSASVIDRTHMTGKQELPDGISPSVYLREKILELLANLRDSED